MNTIEFERSDETFKIINTQDGVSPKEDKANNDKDIDLGVL